MSLSRLLVRKASKAGCRLRRMFSVCAFQSLTLGIGFGIGEAPSVWGNDAVVEGGPGARLSYGQPADNSPSRPSGGRCPLAQSFTVVKRDVAGPPPQKER